MAASVSLIQFRGLVTGKPISAYLYNAAAAAVNTYMPIDFAGEAGTGSPTEFRFEEDVMIEDIIAAGGTPATGRFELIRNGRKTGIFFDYSALSSAYNPRKVPNARLKAGWSYRFQVITALAA